MLGHVVVAIALFPRILYVDSFQLEDETFEIFDVVVENKNCKPSPTDSGRFYLKTGDFAYSLPDLCDGTDLSTLNYFPKCCPPGYNYESSRHGCVLNGGNSTNIYDDFRANLLVRSHLDCPVIIDHAIDERSIIFDKSRSITLNGRTYDVGGYCVDWDVLENSSILRTCESINECKKNRCISKCCKDGRSYVGGKCIANPEFGVSVENNGRFEDRTDDFTGIVQARKCNRFKDKPTFNFTIKRDGGLLIRHINKWMEFSFEENKYCLEYFTRERQYVVFICAFPNTAIVVEYKTYIMRTLNIISCVSLVLTILGYLFLRELKNFLGKIIICYCSCLLFALCFLTFGQFNPSQQDMCVPLGFLVIFFYLAAFAWMNVLSFEIWQVLGSMSTQYGTQLYNERKKFIYYHLYAWSLPLLLLGFGVLSYHTDIIPNNMKPLIGLRYCFIETNAYEKNYGYYIFLAVPSLMYILANSVLFVKTIRYIFKVKNDVRDATKYNYIESQSRFRVDKERVLMVLRIFVIMGLSWLFEFILIFQIDFSKHVVLKAIEMFFDIFNCLQGFFIFCVFMAKKKIFAAVKQKLKPRRSTQRNSTTEVVISYSSK